MRIGRTVCIAMNDREHYLDTVVLRKPICTLRTNRSLHCLNTEHVISVFSSEALPLQTIIVQHDVWRQSIILA
jgi:hypothetical protein